MIPLKCLDCHNIINNRERGTGTKIRCNECQKIHRKIKSKEYNSIYHIENTKYHKKYIKLNKEIIPFKNKIYPKDNKAYISPNRKKNNKKSRIAYQKKYYQDNRVYLSAYQKKYRESKRLKK